MPWSTRLPDKTISTGGGDAQAEFHDALTQAGLIVKGLPVMDGKRHRVATLEDKKGQKSGVYRGFLDRRPGGWFINYHRAETEKSVTNWKASGTEADPVGLAPAPQVVPPTLPPHATKAERPEVPVPVQQTQAPAPEDGWALPASVRSTLPQKLQSAADRQLFTVNYSSGHDRTLYVFADPNCPNCRHLEPALVAAAQMANVVVFPVAVIGREKSIAAITPVLCLPPAQRPASWQALFTVGTDGLQLGKAAAVDKKADSACDVAEKALGVNEVAYQAYRIPGTPWVIADDGRYVPQAVLRDPAQLSQFLNEKETADATTH